MLVNCYEAAVHIAVVIRLDASRARLIFHDHHVWSSLSLSLADDIRLNHAKIFIVTKT
jgi:hypothetical protein